MQRTQLPLIPRISEKSFGLSKQRTYVFVVPTTVNKQQIAAAVAAQHEVTVEKVNIVIAKGKVKQSFRKGGRPVKGRRSDIKKAYVTLAEGDSIKVFEEGEA